MMQRSFLIYTSSKSTRVTKFIVYYFLLYVMGHEIHAFVQIYQHLFLDQPPYLCLI
jgi:hypothetical protein